MKRLLFLLALTAALTGAACGNISPYAAKVNSGTITQKELDRELNAILANTEYLEQVEQQLASQGGKVRGSGKETFDMVFVSRVLTRQILLRLVHDELKARSITLTPEDRAAARTDLEGQFGDAKLFEKFPKAYQEDLILRSAEVVALQKVLIDDAKVKSFYEENAANFAKACSSHILYGAFQGEPPPDQLAAAKAAAEAAKARIDKGEDFAAIAKAESKDNQGPDGGSAAKGGSLGCQAKGTFVPEFEGALETLQPGQVSGVVQTQFGFHLIRLDSRETQTLEQATDEIRQQLSGTALTDFIDGKVKKAKIKVNPRYGTFDTEGESPGVVPPKSPTPAPAADDPITGQPGQPGSGGPPASDTPATTAPTG